MWSRDWGGRVFLFYTLSCCSHIMQPIRDDVMLQHTAGERQWRVRGRRGGGALSFIYLFRLNFGSNRKQKRETRSDKNHVKFKMFPESRWRLNMRQNLKTRFRFYSNQRFKKEKTGIRSKKNQNQGHQRNAVTCCILTGSGTEWGSFNGASRASSRARVSSSNSLKPNTDLIESATSNKENSALKKRSFCFIVEK